MKEECFFTHSEWRIGFKFADVLSAGLLGAGQGDEHHENGEFQWHDRRWWRDQLCARRAGDEWALKWKSTTMVSPPGPGPVWPTIQMISDNSY